MMPGLLPRLDIRYGVHHNGALKHFRVTTTGAGYGAEIEQWTLVNGVWEKISDRLTALGLAALAMSSIYEERPRALQQDDGFLVELGEFNLEPFRAA